MFSSLVQTLNLRLGQLNSFWSVRVKVYPRNTAFDFAYISTALTLCPHPLTPEVGRKIYSVCIKICPV